MFGSQLSQCFVIFSTILDVLANIFFSIYMHGNGAFDVSMQTGSDRASGNTPSYIAFRIKVTFI
jgi:hypothetical protein